MDASQKDAPYAMWVILAGLGAMTLVTVGALVRYDNPTAIVTALGPVTGVIGTLVGAYFGLRGSSLAQQNANVAEVARMNVAASTLGQADVPAEAAVVAPATPVVTQFHANANGNGNGDGNGNAALVTDLRAQDDDDDGYTDTDPDAVALDATPDDEGDDSVAQGVTR